jgi:hypothetical protein
MPKLSRKKRGSKKSSNTKQRRYRAAGPALAHAVAYVGEIPPEIETDNNLGATEGPVTLGTGFAPLQNFNMSTYVLKRHTNGDPPLYASLTPNITRIKENFPYRGVEGTLYDILDHLDYQPPTYGLI